MNVLGENIRRLRKERGLSIKDLAKSGNLSPAGISQIENGKRDPTIKTVTNIAQILNVDVATLVTPFANQFRHTIHSIINFSDQKKLLLGISFNSNNHVKWLCIFHTTNNIEMIEVRNFKNGIEEDFNFKDSFLNSLYSFLNEQEQQSSLRSNIEINNSYDEATKNGMEWDSLKSLITHIYFNNI